MIVFYAIAADPDSFYGFEKLFSEYSIGLARYHNI